MTIARTPVGEGGAPARRRSSPEHTFQAWVDRLIDRIVLPPMFVTGIDHASQSTDNARARMAGRGIRFGIPDVFVAQRDGIMPRCAWLELKRGSKLSGAQEAVHRSLHAAGQDVTTCSTMAEVVLALRAFRFHLHPNADELAREYELRVTTNEKAPATPGKSRPRSRVSSGRIAKAHKAGAWRMTV